MNKPTVGKDVESGTLTHCWRECEILQPLWKSVWKFLEKLHIHLPHDPVILLTGIYLREMKVYPHTKMCTVYTDIQLYLQ